MAKIIGIDLGTTNSVVAVMEGDTVKVLTNTQGARTTPSVVGVTGKGERLVGRTAHHQQVTNPKNTISSIKRFMGRRSREVGDETVPYKLVGHGDGMVKVEVQGKEYTPSEISAMILCDLKKTAEDYLGEPVERAVITVPAYFNDAQRKATKDAGEIAGLTVERIINEPTAAALAYGLDKGKEQRIAVFDLGGGTFDVSILEIDPDIGIFEVLSTSGDGRLGGDNYDDALIDHLAEGFRKQEGVDIRTDPTALQRLRESAEKAKCELSTAMETTVNLPYITANDSGPKHLQETITRSKFEQITAGLTDRCRNPVADALAGANLKASDIDDVVLVGGSTRIPAVRKLCRELFGREPNKGVNPDEVVAAGAAIQGAVLSGDKDDIVLLDVTPLTLGLETLGGVVTKLIDANTTIPTSKSETFSTAADGQTEVTIHVLQGNRAMAVDNRTLGQFNLSGIAPGPRGIPQIDVVFDIDRNGIISVSAKDKATGKEQSIKIEGAGGLDKGDIERMRQEAEECADDDRRKSELVALRNTADAMAFQVEQQLQELGEKVSPETRGKVESGITALRETLKGDDQAAIDGAKDSLMRDAQEMGKMVYEEAAAQAAEDSAAEVAENPEEDIIDAEFEAH